jgi:hypothetical protein
MTLHTLANWIDVYPVLVPVASHSRSGALLTAVGVAVVFLALIWFQRGREIRMLAQGAAKIFRGSPASSLIAGLLIGGVLLAIWPYHPAGLWAGLGGVGLIGLSLVEKRLRSVRPSPASCELEDRTDPPG